MKDMDGILVLLEDLKDLLYGIAWLILGGIFSMAGIFLIPNMGMIGLVGILLLLISLFLLFAGILYVRRGYHHHSVEVHEET